VTVRASLAIATLLVWMGGCGGQETGPRPGSTADAPAADSATATPTASPAGAPATRPTSEWQDPEPPEAQALAESVLAAEWNRNKVLPLKMIITTLVDRTSGIQGFATALAPKEVSLEDRLARLGADVTGTEVIIRLPGSVLFDFDSASIRVDAERTLGEVAEVLAAYKERPIRVEGHTDSIASDAYNHKLSEERAGSVVRWLAAHGVAVGRMRPRGLGETQPVADNATPAGRQLNRRVEIVVEKAP
jgi:outer membrane protein OmpA-like peptidoglycan-associated protein